MTLEIRPRLTGLLLGLTLVLAGCDTEGITVVDDVDLAGSYTLVSITFEGQPTLTPPAATGTLVLTETRYDVDITIQTEQGPNQISDEGSYEVDGNSWSQTSDDGDIQSVGTFELDGDVLTVDVTTQNQRVVNVWERT